jgi:hypothetical protein
VGLKQSAVPGLRIGSKREPSVEQPSIVPFAAQRLSPERHRSHDAVSGSQSVAVQLGPLGSKPVWFALQRSGCRPLQRRSVGSQTLSWH